MAKRLIAHGDSGQSVRSAVLPLSILALSILAGCAECKTTNDCPWGQVCSNGSCQSWSFDSGTDGDQDTGTDPVPDTLTDDTGSDQPADPPVDTLSEWLEDTNFPDEYLPDAIDDTNWPDEWVPDMYEDFPTDERFDEVPEDAPVYDCWIHEDCDDLNECTDDYCTPARVCLNAPAREGLDCGDGVFCNGVETCQGGLCLPDVPACDDFNPCTSDTCSEGPSGPVCGHSDEPDGTDCDNGLWCDGPDACTGGACVSGPQPCPRFHTNACMHWVCQSATESCTEENQPDGTDCNDGNQCNGIETCLSGACTPSPEAPCDDFNPCTADSCTTPGGILTCTNTEVADGTGCSGSGPCDSAGMQCFGGTCTPGAACIDGSLCTLDRCDGETGACSHSGSLFETVDCGSTIDVYTLATPAEVSSYGGCGSGFASPEMVLQFSAATAPSNLLLTYTPRYSSGTLRTLLLTDACAPSTCYASDTGLVADFAAPGSSAHIVIDGYFDGTVVVTCP